MRAWVWVQGMAGQGRVAATSSIYPIGIKNIRMVNISNVLRH